MALRHFLTLNDLSPAELDHVIARAIELKAEHRERRQGVQFPNYVLGMIFEKASTRTRISFEAGIAQFGGHAIFLSPRDTQLGRGEPTEDSARVISSMCDIVMIRTFEHSIIEKFAEYSSVPVINALTDDYHPCQLLADIQTFVEHRGSIKGKQVTWVGDGNNMCQSYINAAIQFDFKLKIACPEGFDPRADLVEAAGDRVEIIRDPAEAAKGSDLLVTDVWASMGQEEEKAERRRKLAGYQINAELMSHANPDALYMHCLPAKRGEEISAELMDSPDTVIWDEAENRLHAQKALMEFLLTQ
ncbi:MULTISPECIES: ornithine carbamoyltransferase [Spongiibacter]|jgi:ornithine carbamoyltransferase|uniref:ornithine carbamoyltransferase n=1 Tax=Spongiibacter TaxID=630749 RepID=UPI000C0953AA|nr:MULTISPECIES: ornithine carbamoyltransferase [Spongiibacter]MAK43741.1 ornithine carbamoyltransferase [Spongiibacter sp.]MBM7422441.1 ornithine carbamoyltransferase [Spongiibacter marinus]MEE2652002.1 ornithine carbamoyltransferase [Pseudomonadota bacterium]|tara:strand:+ start:2364 stop:3269 length:906 start_codon:yes stop_codon:yes gene_type:complete